MLLIKTYIGPSKINGTGLFADQLIPKGTLTWKVNPHLDMAWSEHDIENLPEIARTTFLKYAYLSTRTGLYVLCFDNARFLNHHPNPNIGDADSPESEEGIDMALRDIQPGEELTCDYHLFDARYPAGL